MKPRLIAFISYIFFFGWFFALVLNQPFRTRFASFHIRQSFGILCLGSVGGIIVILLNYFFPSVLVTWLSLLGVVIPLSLLWLLGVVQALSGKAKPLPVFGSYFQNWFGSL